VPRIEPVGQKTYTFWRHFDTIGDGTGDTDFIGDYSVTPVVPRMDCAEDEFLFIHYVTTIIEDATKFDPSKYGNLPALTNGITMGVYGPDGVERHRFNQHTIKTAAAWIHQAESSVAQEGTGAHIFIAKLEFTGISADGYRLYPGDSLRVVLNDNFTGLDDHEFVAHGTRIATNV